jgi:hypothetical protein
MKPGKVTAAIHQPNFLPRLSTLTKLYTADWWVVLDSVQFTQRDYQHRCRLAPLAARPARQQNMSPQWLSLAVNRPQGRSSRIDAITLDDPQFERERIARTLRQFYRRGADPNALEKVIAEITSALNGSNRLVDVAEASTLALLHLLEWPGSYIRASTIPAGTGRSERLAELTDYVGAEIYLCGRGGARYLDETPFVDRGLSVSYLHSGHSTASDPEDPGTSALHKLMEIGIEGIRRRVLFIAATMSPPGIEPPLELR